MIRGLIGAVLCLTAAAAMASEPDVSIEYAARVTLDTDPGACAYATEEEMVVTEGTQAQFCFLARNTGEVTFNYHDLDVEITTEYGGPDEDYRRRLRSHEPIALAPGETAFIPWLVTVVEDMEYRSTWTAKDDLPQYTHAPAAYDFIDISATGTPVTVISAYGGGAVALPFEFTFYGVRSDQMVICSGGYLNHASQSTGCGLPYVSDFPYPQLPLAILPFPGPYNSNYGAFWHQTLGTAPNRRFVAQWHRFVNPYSGPMIGDGVSFEAILHEADGSILFQYRDVFFADEGEDFVMAYYNYGSRSAVGLNYDDGLAHEYSYWSPSLSAGQAIRWTPNHIRQARASGTARVIVQAPAIAATPRHLERIVALGEQVQEQVVIANTGNAALDWRIDQATGKGRGHIPKQARRAVASQRPGPYRLDDPASGAKRAAAREPLDFPPRPARAAVRSKGLPPPPAAYGRDGAGSDNYFSRIDLSTGELTPLVSSFIFYNAAIDFHEGDFSYLLNVLFGSGLHIGNLQTYENTYVGGSGLYPGYLISNIASDSSNGVIYGIAVICGEGAGDSRLYRISRETGQMVPVGVVEGFGCIRGLASNANGELFGIDVDTDTLVAIDKHTGAGHAIGPIGFNADNQVGLDFDEDANVLYMATWNATRGAAELSIVDTATGQASAVADFHYPDDDLARITNLAIESGGGGCVDPASVPWLSVEPASGLLAAGDEAEVTVNFDARSLPEGRYEALLCLHSNAPADRFLTLPVRLDVLAPDISLQPASIGAAAVVGERFVTGLTIGNAGPGRLDWSALAAVAGDCGQPLDLPWLSVSPAAGSVAAGAPAATPGVTLDAATLAAGRHEASLCVLSNDPDSGVIEIPVVFTVMPMEIFRSGFEPGSGP